MVYINIILIDPYFIISVYNSWSFALTSNLCAIYDCAYIILFKRKNNETTFFTS